MRSGRPGGKNSVRVSVRIQAHPSRKHLLPTLLSRLEPLPTEVSFHSSDPPNPWEGYKKAIADPPDCTHLLVIQEDALVCNNFPLAVEQIAQAKADPVALFLAWLPRNVAVDAFQASLRGERYIRYRPGSKFCPVVALLWPIDALERFKAWAACNPLPGRPTPASDDAIVGEWYKRNQASETIWVSVPSLVEHPDMTESVKGRRNEVWGRDKGRVAAMYIGDEDPLSYDWFSAD